MHGSSVPNAFPGSRHLPSGSIADDATFFAFPYVHRLEIIPGLQVKRSISTVLDVLSSLKTFTALSIMS